MIAGRRLLLRAGPGLLAGLVAAAAARPGATLDGPADPGLVMGTRAGLVVRTRAGLVVRTRAGLVHGLSRDGVRAFLGIPFGHVPARFQPAQPASPWSGPYAATRFGPAAVQRLGGSANGIVSSEQCLSLNVWSPLPPDGAASPPALLPVLVWVHGGANVSGASSQPIYDGGRFARSGVVCVTFNYRLGVWGFLELGAALGGRYRGSGNNALRDQMLALRWVQDNIARFGGDPGRVTIAGESAGAKDVAALLASPAARGLFGRAILESGGGRTVLSMEAAHAVSLRYLDLLGLKRNGAARLLQMDTERLIEAQHALMRDAPFSYPLRPLVDGALLPAMPETAIALGCAARTPLLLGTNRDESRLFLARRAAARPIEANSLSNMDPGTFEHMLQHYDAATPDGDLAEIRWRALTAEEYWIPSVRVAEAQSDAGGQVWMYRFDKPAESGLFEGHAAHVSELPYVWNNPDDPELAPLTTGFDAALAARMHAAWVSFIAGGAPVAAGLPDWPRYDAQNRATMILDATSRVENDPSATERRLWSRLFLAEQTR